MKRIQVIRFQHRYGIGKYPVHKNVVAAGLGVTIISALTVRRENEDQILNRSRSRIAIWGGL